MMRSVVVLVLILAVLPTLASADYFTDRQAAATLAKEGKHAAALDAFIALASGDVIDAQKSDALTQAVRCAVAMKNHDRAAELARQIPLAPQSKLAQMMVLHSNHKIYPELLSQFSGEDLSRWPQHVAADAYLMRGEAAARSNAKWYELAVADLTMAVRFPMDTRTRAETLNLLGSVHAHLGHEDEALALFQRVSAMTDPYRAAGAATNMARIYEARGQRDKVAEVINAIQLDHIAPGSFRSGLLLSMGDTLAAIGDHDGAILRYRQVMAENSDSEQFKATCESKIAALQAK